MDIAFLKILFWVSVALLGYCYGLYPAFLVLFSKMQKRSLLLKTGGCPTVSIIISAYNEETVIEKRIKNCLSVDYPKDRVEIIIASDGSDDKTAGIVAKYKRHGVILLDYKRRQGKVNVLNKAIGKAKNEIVIFSDANTDFKEDAVRNLVRHFDDPVIGCVCGLLRFLSAEGSESGELEGVYWRYETAIKTIEGSKGVLLGANGAIYAIRKELYYVCPPDTIVEDLVIPMKVLERGFKVVFDPEAIAYEETAKHIVQEKQRRIRIGAGDFQALVMLFHMLDPRRGFAALAFWSHKVLRWLGPFFLAAAFFSNLVLLSEDCYKYTFIVQSTFYIFAFIGQMLSWASIPKKPFSLCYYFVSMNLGLLLGFVRFVTGTQKVTWKRTER